MSKKKSIGCALFGIVILIVAQLLAGLIGSVFVLCGVPNWICNILAGILYLVFAIFGVVMILGKAMHLDMDELGIKRFSLRFRWILTGLLLPLGVIAVYLLMIPGEYVSSGLNNRQMLDTLSSGIFFTGIAAGFVEEIVFRGVIFRSLEKSFGKNIGIFVPSLLFGIVHILGMDITPFGCLLVIIAGTAVGVMFSMITIESGSVWDNGLVHALWNILIIGGGIAIAGAPDDSSIVSYVLKSDSFAITGGEFGIESSAVALAGYVIVTIVAWYMIRKRAK
ncbi:MAG: CPBP family intramembrane metalloprotease [Lachnospiraceae bacterium]|nr:CPBP family intramembrane metalloprotease [Lachnospiraceae bacterium]